MSHSTKCAEAIVVWRKDPTLFQDFSFTQTNWGNGWSWYETHNKFLPDGYRIKTCTDTELELGYCENPHRPPVFVLAARRDPAHPDSAESAWKQMQALDPQLKVTVATPGKPAKTLNLDVLRTYRHHYSGADMLELSFNVICGLKGSITLDLYRHKTLYAAQKSVNAMFSNRLALAAYCADPKKFRSEINSWDNWGNGWSWTEKSHDLQPDDYRLTMGGGVGDLCIKRSYNCNAMPTEVAHFTKQKEMASC